MKVNAIRLGFGGAVWLSLIVGFATPGVADTHSDWLEWKEKGRREQASLSYPKAEEYYVRSIAEATKIGPDSVELVESKIRLAACLVCQKKFDEAEPYYQWLLTTVEKSRKNKSLNAEVLVWLEELADSYASTGTQTRGRKQFGLEHALALRDLISGDEHPEISITLKQLGKLYLQQGNSKAAEAVVARLVRVDQKYLGYDHNVVADDLCGLGMIAADLQKWDESESYFRQALAILMKTDPVHHTVQYYNARVMMARSVLKKDELALSEKEATEALADFERGDGKGKNSFLTASALHIIASVRLKQKRYDDAIKLYTKSIALLEPVFGQNDYRMIHHWRRMQRVYIAMKATDKVNEIEQRIKAIEAASRTNARN